MSDQQPLFQDLFINYANNPSFYPCESSGNGSYYIDLGRLVEDFKHCWQFQDRFYELQEHFNTISLYSKDLVAKNTYLESQLKDAISQHKQTAQHQHQIIKNLQAKVHPKAVHAAANQLKAAIRHQKQTQCELDTVTESNTALTIKIKTLEEEHQKVLAALQEKSQSEIKTLHTKLTEQTKEIKSLKNQVTKLLESESHLQQLSEQLAEQQQKSLDEKSQCDILIQQLKEQVNTPKKPRKRGTRSKNKAKGAGEQQKQEQQKENSLLCSGDTTLHVSYRKLACIPPISPTESVHEYLDRYEEFQMEYKRSKPDTVFVDIDKQQILLLDGSQASVLYKVKLLTENKNKLVTQYSSSTSSFEHLNISSILSTKGEEEQKEESQKSQELDISKLDSQDFLITQEAANRIRHQLDVEWKSFEEKQIMKMGLLGNTEWATTKQNMMQGIVISDVQLMANNIINTMENIVEAHQNVQILHDRLHRHDAWMISVYRSIVIPRLQTLSLSPDPTTMRSLWYQIMQMEISKAQDKACVAQELFAAKFEYLAMCFRDVIQTCETCFIHVRNGASGLESTLSGELKAEKNAKIRTRLHSLTKKLEQYNEHVNALDWNHLNRLTHRVFAAVSELKK